MTPTFLSSWITTAWPGWLRWLLIVGVAPLAMAEDTPEFAARIDTLVLARAAGQPVSAAADDAEFLRRVWRDFDGGIPTADEARKFFADQTADKRSRLIDELMNAPRFPERMADAFDVMLMERRGDDREWKNWLSDSFCENKPWDAMVREMLAPDFLSESQRGAGYFITRRIAARSDEEPDYPGLTRDVGRLFMGVDSVTATGLSRKLEANMQPLSRTWKLAG